MSAAGVELEGRRRPRGVRAQSRPATVRSQPPEQVGQARADFISKGKLSVDSCQAAQKLGLQSSKVPGFRGEDHCRA